MTRPAAIVEVQPTKIATFTAVQYDTMFSQEGNAALAWMAERFGWELKGETTVYRGGKKFPALLLVGKNKHRYKVTDGDWVIALGSNGSLRVVSDKQYRQDYKKVER